jgi:hypothetical protein
MTKIKVTKAPYTCPEPTHLTPDLTTDSFYSDSKGSIIDPVKWKGYQESSGPVKKLGQDAVDADRKDVLQPGLLRAGMGRRRSRYRPLEDPRQRRRR